jgi:hypothetical protein
MRQHDQRAGERVGAAPSSRGLVHVAADDPAAQPRGERLEVLPVRAGHPVGVVAIVGVGPRATHHPVVQTLTADAEAVLRPVLRPHNVAIDRGRDGCDDLTHGSSFVRVRHIRPSRTPRLIGGAHYPRAMAPHNGTRDRARSELHSTGDGTHTPDAVPCSRTSAVGSSCQRASARHRYSACVVARHPGPDRWMIAPSLGGCGNL